MPPRRPAPDDGEDSGPPRQRIRSESGAPVAVQHNAQQHAAQANSQAASIQAQIAAAKARAAALAASLSAGQGGAACGLPNANAARTAGAQPSLARPAAQATTAPGARLPAATAASPSSGIPSASDIQARIAAARAKIGGLSSAAGLPQARPPTQQQPQGAREERPTGIHPLLMQSSGKGAAAASLKPMAPKFSTVRANAQSAQTNKKWPGARYVEPDLTPVANPYLSAAVEATEEGEGSSAVPKNRSTHKGFQFHRPGKLVERAEELRREAKLEEMKRRIAENSKKAGLDGTGEERMLRKRPPPDFEWWDVDLLPKKAGGEDSAPLGYEDVAIEPEMASDINGKGKAKAEIGVPQPLIEGSNSPITFYIQHPIPIPPPGDKDKIPMRGVMLTKKEMKKLRRQRRQAEIQDKRDRVKMGLLPPPPPKVKLSNLMRVLTSEAVADPTKIEARVRREVAARKEAHDRMNQDRKLTPDQRREKLEAEKEKDESKGLSCLVYKIQHLVSPAHKFKIRRNARQLGLTGITVFGKDFALVIVEGGAKAIKSYRRLMTVRIDWTDPGRPKDTSDGEDEEAEAGNSHAADNAQAQQEIQDIDWSKNTCELIFEGPIRERTWPNGFRGRGAETDADAREELGSRASLWDVARRWNAATEEV